MYKMFIKLVKQLPAMAGTMRRYIEKEITATESCRKMQKITDALHKYSK